MEFLTGKRILLVAPRFFGYEAEIAEELQRQGAIVDWIPDRPFDAPAMKALTKLRPKWIWPIADRFYDSLLAGFGVSQYDIILVINGQTMSSHMLRRLRSEYPSARLILYLWDSIANRKHVRDNLLLYDQVYTFDPADGARYQMRLRPLFYGHGFNLINSLSEQLRYQISFVGTAHSDRYSIVDHLRQGLPTDISSYWYLYLQAPWVMYYYRLTKPSMRYVSAKDFHFDPLEKSKLQEVFRESLSILDIEHPLQKGLTMRTFETLGAGKKLVTTNAGIRNYEFFSPENICVIDRKNPHIPKDFLASPFVPLSEAVRDRYSISGWVAEVLEK